jgi:hypothetical protein
MLLKGSAVLEQKYDGSGKSVVEERLDCFVVGTVTLATVRYWTVMWKS